MTQIFANQDENPVVSTWYMYVFALGSKKKMGNLIVLSSGSEVRLVDGPRISSGRAEIYYNRQWGTICQEWFDTREAR